MVICPGSIPLMTVQLRAATICRAEGIRELTDFQVLLQPSVFMALHIFKINLFPLPLFQSQFL